MTSSSVQKNNNVVFDLLLISNSIQEYRKCMKTCVLDENLKLVPRKDFLRTDLIAVNIANKVLPVVLPCLDFLITLKSKMTPTLFTQFNSAVELILEHMDIEMDMLRVHGIVSKVHKNVARAEKCLNLIINYPTKLDQLQLELKNSKPQTSQEQLSQEQAQLLKQLYGMLGQLDSFLINQYGSSVAPTLTPPPQLAPDSTMARCTIKLSSAAIDFLDYTNSLYNQLAISKKALNLAETLGFNIESFFNSTEPQFKPLELTQFGSDCLSKNLISLHSQISKALLNCMSSESKIDQKSLFTYLEPIVSAFVCEPSDQIYARLIVEAHILHAYLWKTRKSPETISAITKLIARFPSQSSLSKEFPIIGANFVNYNATGLYKNAQILQLLFLSPETLAKLDQNKKNELVDIAHTVMAAFDFPNKKTLESKRKACQAHISNEVLILFAREFQRLFFKHYSEDSISKNLGVYASTQFHQVVTDAYTRLPINERNSYASKAPLPQRIQALTFDISGYFTYKGPAYHDLLKMIKGGVKLNFNPSAVETLPELIAVETPLVASTPATTTTITTIPDDSTFTTNNLLDLLQYAPRVARWFLPTTQNIFAYDPNYRNLPKEKYREMVCRHGFTKAVERLLPTHFVAVDTATSFGPCTLFLARGCMVLAKSRHEVVIEICASKDGMIYHRYLSDPKENSSHKLADELLSKFSYETVPNATLGEWTIVGAHAKESENNEKVIIYDEKLKMTLEIYKSAKKK